MVAQEGSPEADKSAGEGRDSRVHLLRPHILQGASATAESPGGGRRRRVAGGSIDGGPDDRGGPAQRSRDDGVKVLRQ